MDLSPPASRRPSGVDVLLAALFAVVVGVESFTEPAVTRPFAHAMLGVPAMAAMSWRRAWPLGVTAVVVTAAGLLALDSGGLSVVLALVVMAFTVGSETTSPRRSWLGLGLLLVPFMVGSVAQYGGLHAGDTAAAGVLIVGPWVAGRTLRERAAGLAEALARADRLELEREREAEDAALRERTRLARELHDIVSHSISVVTIQAQAVRRRLGPGQEREIADLAAMETAAREAMADMRRLFGVLRADGERVSLAPQPGLAELEQLVAQARATGVAVDLDRRGLPVDLPPGLELAAYRIVQEGITNALRHSGGRQVKVCLDYEPCVLTVSVEDDGQGLVAPTDGGHGLTGVRERAEMYGGVLTMSRGTLGGARLEATFPVTTP